MKLPLWTATLATMQRPVFCTERITVSMSSGTRLRRSITSADTPLSAASFSAAFRQSCTAGPQETKVRSLPSRFTSATPIGTRCSPSGTGPLAP